MDERFAESVLDRSMLYSRCETKRERERDRGRGRKDNREDRREKGRKKIFLKRGMNTSNE